MMGKEKCSILKEIRQRIAAENEIPYVTRECSHKGPCSGTCPHCESEVRYLETQLKKRASLGKEIKIAAVCTGIALTLSSCSAIEDVFRKPEPSPTPWIEELSGEVLWPEPTEEETTAEPTEAPAVQFPENTNDPVYIPDDLMGYVPSNL